MKVPANSPSRTCIKVFLHVLGFYIHPSVFTVIHSSVPNHWFDFSTIQFLEWGNLNPECFLKHHYTPEQEHLYPEERPDLGQDLQFELSVYRVEAGGRDSEESTPVEVKTEIDRRVEVISDG